MSTLLVAIILVVSIIALVWIFIKIDTKRRRKKDQAYINNFNSIATQNDIVITKHEIFRNKIIGIDNLKKMLLVFEFENSNNPILINLADTNTCMLVKEYGHLNAGNEKKPRMERYLQSIDLKFSIKSKPESISISFYENHVNNIYEIVDLEVRAKDWEAILSQIIPKHTRHLI
jgi:hypothetical protein